MQIVNEKGERLYFTEEQRKALLAAAAKAPREVRSFCSVLCYTGCRISEALALTAKSIDLSAKVIVIESLKKRKAGVHRQVPVPPDLLDQLRTLARPGAGPAAVPVNAEYTGAVVGGTADFTAVMS